MYILIMQIHSNKCPHRTVGFNRVKNWLCEKVGK